MLSPSPHAPVITTTSLKPVSGSIVRVDTLHVVATREGETRERELVWTIRVTFPADAQGNVVLQVNDITDQLKSDTLPVDPIVKLHYVEVEPPDLASPTGDAERLLASLEREIRQTMPQSAQDVVIEGVRR